MNIPAARWSPILLLMLSGCGSRSVGPVWNVPELVGQPIDVVKQKLGAPQNETVSGDGTKQSSWQREGTTLVASWKTSNKRVKEWTLTSRENSNAVREEERAQLLIPGQLKENVPAYSVDFVEAPERPLFYNAVHVIPALKNHNVVLRLSGDPALVEITYAAAGQPETFQTLPPFEQTLTAPDDTQITFKVAPKKALVGDRINLKLEILADGKVVSSAISTGGTTTCQTEL